MMRIHYSYRNLEKDFDIAVVPLVIGCGKEGVPVDLNLTPDPAVSGVHARIWREGKQFWIEDLDSTCGTQVDGREIKGRGKQRLNPGNSIQIGNTILTVSVPSAVLATSPPVMQSPNPGGEVMLTPDAMAIPFTATEINEPGIARRLALLHELPLQFGEENCLENLFQLILQRVIDVIDGARRGAVLIKDPVTGKLALKAHMPAGQPAISLSLVQQAISQHVAIIWPQPARGTAEGVGRPPTSESIREFRIESAMYVPLLWRGEALGVLCVDNCETCGAFESEDLKLLKTVAQHAAMAVAHLQLTEKWRSQAEVQENLLRLVSPRVAERLIGQRGRIRLGGEFCDATMLLSDIRGFTNLSATMSPQDVTDMLEDYYGLLVPIVYKHQGTIDKFIGDAILAVYGSPERDELQHLHAVYTALEMQAAMSEVNARRSAQGKQVGEMAIGIHCGEVVHGLIGSNERMEFTVIGDAVNRTSRYCDGARGGEVLISPEAYQWVWNSIEVEPTSFMSKHEGNLSAYQIKRIRPHAKATRRAAPRPGNSGT